ncbi:MAG: hypothetical protein WDZ35_02035 [Crocinitomicaceae bacterium]
MTNDELLDNDPISKHTVDISYNNGHTFGVSPRVFAGIFTLFGLLMILSGGAGFFVGPLVLLIGLFVLTSIVGTDICYRTKYVREYHKRFFIKTGKWKSTQTYPDLCILKLGKSKRQSDMSSAVSTDIDISKNEVYLMTANHRKRILIRTCDNLAQAKETAELLAEKLGKSIQPFRPAITQKTQERLRFRK